MAALAIVMTCGLTILFPVLEREVKSCLLCAMRENTLINFNIEFVLQLKIRPQLRVSGVSFFQYWFSLLVPDYTIYFLVCSAFVICLAAFQISFFYTSGAMIALVSFYKLWYLGFLYILSFLSGCSWIISIIFQNCYENI